MKKVLILTVSNGESYNMVARAIANGFATRYSSVSFKIIDIFRVNKSLEFNFAGEDSLKEKIAHKIENDRYSKAKHSDNIEQKKKIINKYISTAEIYVERCIKNYEPDIIISTHIFPAVIISNMEMDNNIKTIFVSADYTTSPYLELAKNLDLYVVNSKAMANEYVSFGIEKTKCMLLGIPLINRFYHSTQREDARELLKLKEDKFTILITNGVKKRDNNFKLVKSIVNKFDDSDIIVVCNKNINLQNKIKKFIKSKSLQNVKVLGHTNNIDVLISASDVVLGKTSGVEITQAMALDIPYVATLKISGQELDNMKFLKECNLIINAKTISRLIERLEEYKENKKLQTLYKQKIAKFYLPNATDELVKIAFHM